MFRRSRPATIFIAIIGLLSGAVTDGAAEIKTSQPESLLQTYINPLNVSAIADPFVLKTGDTYYMYGTNDDVQGQGFDVLQSKDLVTWTRVAKCYAPTKDSWGNSYFWAPEVVEKDGVYYMHFTSYNRDEGRRNISFARSDSPEGPFVEYAAPIFPGSVIDSHVYHDEKSGQYYIYATPERDSPGILGARLSSDFKRLETSPTYCMKAEYGWEDLWIEGPVVHEHEGTLYMLFSGGAWWEAEYSLGYATAQSPLGPWTKSPANPVLKNNENVDGPGHNGLAWSPDGSELFVMYHVHAGDWTVHRVAAMDRIIFENAAAGGPDILTIPGAPSSTPQPLPSGAAPLRLAKSDDFEAARLDWSQWNVYANYANQWEIADGELRITADGGDFWRTHSGRNVFLQHMPEGDFDIETSITMQATQKEEQAFLVLWEDEDNYVMLSAVYLDGLQFAMTREFKGKPDTGLAKNDFGWPVCLRIAKRGDNITFYASPDGEDWKEVGRGETLGGVTPRYVGLGAWSPGSDRETQARFGWFHITKR